MSTPSLYQLTQDFIDLMNVLEVSEGDITPEQEAQLTLTGDGLQQKIDGYYKVRQTMLRQADGLKDEITELQLRKKHVESSLDRLDGRITNAMEALATTELRGVTHRVRKVGVGGLRKLVAPDPAALPPELMVVTPVITIDGVAARKLLATILPEVDGSIVLRDDEGKAVMTLMPQGERLSWA